MGGGNEIKAASVLEVSNAYDHRFIDGMTAPRFTAAVKEKLENMGA